MIIDTFHSFYFFKEEFLIFWYFYY